MPPQTISNAGDKSTCRLCGRQLARYNCPTCNVPYCSLTCFRSPAHSQCSETFYKKEVENDIQSEPSKTPQERMRMMEMLKKFEEDNQRSVADEMESDEEEDDDDLARRFQDIDMDSASTADLWAKLTPAEQEQFRKLMDDPTSGLAQQLLASEELENERYAPWWDADVVADNPDGQSPPHRRYGARPEVIQIPSAIVKPIPNGPPLFYNICAVCIAYSFTTRHLSVSPLSSLQPEDVDFEEARRLISQLVPFLTARKSATLFPNLSSLMTDIWSRFEPGQINSELFALLLRDTAYLIRPLPVIALPEDSQKSKETFDPTSHPHVNLIRVLSDTSKLFEMSARKGVAPKPNHVTQKLLFYIGYVLSTPSPIQRALSDELMEKSAAYRARDAEDVVTEPGSVNKGKHHKTVGKATIEEL
ncbi:hypothetical protein FPV67DRAFT_1475407 [Lyophyllum atratum]|nr:hypothetical protein FPV67DRAFT_1475407 [Lyophyllum atratum]